MKRIFLAMALVGAGLLAGFGVGLLQEKSGPSQSYSDGFAYGAYVVGQDNPMGNMNCEWNGREFRFGAPIPKGNDPVQYSQGCYTGFNNADVKVAHHVP